MPHGKKLKALYDENKTKINVFCGTTFNGTQSCVLLKQRLHLMTCPICKQAVEQGHKGYTKEELRKNLPKPGETGFRISGFADPTQQISKAEKRSQHNTPVAFIVNPEKFKD